MNKKIKPHNYVKKKKKKKTKDKYHHTFSYGPNLLLNSQPHIYFTVIISHTDPIIHKFTTSEKREEREREGNLKRRWRSVHRSKAGGDRCTDRSPVEIVVHRSKAGGDRCTDRRPVGIVVHRSKAGGVRRLP